jgi:recombination protein RecT
MNAAVAPAPIDVAGIHAALQGALVTFDADLADLLKSAGNVVVRDRYEAGLAADLIKRSRDVAEQIERAELTVAAPLHDALASVQAVTESYWADVRNAIAGVRTKVNQFRGEEQARIAAQQAEQDAEEARLRALNPEISVEDHPSERLSESIMAQPQRQQGGKPAPMNAAQRQSGEDKLSGVLAELYERRSEIASLLPADIAFESFHASVNQALRMNPGILRCHGPSIVNACIKAAYDGLKLDGREATIVSNNVKFATRPDQWREEARYMPMVFGLRKQILQSGLVHDVYTMLVWENEPFQVRGGLDRDILHEVLPDSKRGQKLKAVYSVAVLSSGVRTFEVMWRADVDEVRNAAQTDMVWNKWEGEMWRKTVLRRHRKSLPSTRDVRDAEAVEMFPQFAGNSEKLALPDSTQGWPSPPALAAPAQRFDYDFGGGPAQKEPVEDRRSTPEPQQTQTQHNNNDDRRGEALGTTAKEARRESLPPLPDGAEEWLTWSKDLLSKICACSTVDTCNALWTDSMVFIDHAPDDARDTVIAAFTDRTAELAADPDTGAAPVDGQSDRAAEKQA